MFAHVPRHWYLATLFFNVFEASQSCFSFVILFCEQEFFLLIFFLLLLLLFHSSSLFTVRGRCGAVVPASAWALPDNAKQFFCLITTASVQWQTISQPASLTIIISVRARATSAKVHWLTGRNDENESENFFPFTRRGKAKQNQKTLCATHNLHVLHPHRLRCPTMMVWNEIWPRENQYSKDNLKFNYAFW